VILVTGGCGFLGSHLVHQLRERTSVSEAIRVFDLPGPHQLRLPQTGVEFHPGDIRDHSAVSRAVSGCQHVYHLAGNPNLWTRRRKDFFDVNTQGTGNVISAAISAGAQRVLYVSTESILGSVGERDQEIETYRPQLKEMLGAYCQSKLLGEEIAFDWAKRGYPVLVAAPTLPVGPGDYSMTPPTRMTVSFCRGELPALVECRLNLADARDVAWGMIKTMERGQPGKRYLLGGWNVLLSDWLALVGTYVGRSAPRWRVPYAMALAVAWCSERYADWVSGQVPNATVTGVRLTRRNMHFDPTNTWQELDWRPRPLSESAADAVAWYRAMGWLMAK
jgi:dihydroflavonol-4-reductase